MNRHAYQKPGRVLMIWGLLCAVGAALLLGYDVALARYATELRENDYHTYLGYATERLEDKDYLGALRHVERAKQLAPRNPEPFAYAGGIHYQQKHWKRAIKDLEHAIENGDASRGPRMDVVWSLIELERYDEAAVLGERFIGEVEDNTLLMQYAAEAHLRGRHPENAIPLLERALEASPDNLHHLSRLAGAYRATDNKAAAEKTQARIAAIHDAIGQLGTSAQ